MEGKKSFILYADLVYVADQLSNETKGILFQTILDYVNDRDPQPDDILIKIAFEPVKHHLKRDLKHWNEVKATRSKSGKLGGRPKKQTKAKKANAFFEKQTKPKKAVTVKDWRSDFSIYLNDLHTAHKQVLNDLEFMDTQQKFHPGMDIKLTLEKVITNFWGTEEGWKHKKKGKIKEINWRITLLNALDLKGNKVWQREKGAFADDWSEFDNADKHLNILK